VRFGDHCMAWPGRVTTIDLGGEAPLDGTADHSLTLNNCDWSFDTMPDSRKLYYNLVLIERCPP
jgi:hypothetical protein